MQATKTVKSTKAIMGVEPAIGSEWDAGFVPFGCAFRRVRVTVRNDGETWTVYALGKKGDITLAQHTVSAFPCETCAKAFALCLVFGSGYAECIEHGQSEFDALMLFNGTVKILLSLMGISPDAWLDDGARHRVQWVTRLLLDGQLDWQKVIAEWESAEIKGMPLSATVSFWFAGLR